MYTYGDVVVLMSSELYIGIGVTVVLLYRSVGKGVIDSVMGVVLLIGGAVALSIEGDGIERGCKALMCLSSGVLVSIGGIERKEWSLVVSLSVVGLCVMISSSDLIGMYVGYELQTLSYYVLVSKVFVGRRSSYGAESGIKYYMIGGIMGGVYLMGSSIVYGETGSVELECIERISEVEETVWLSIGKGLVMISIVYKLGAVPLHMWLVDVVDGGSVSSGGVMMLVPKVGMIGVVMKLEGWYAAEWLVYGGVISIWVGVVGVYREVRIKRWLVYSGVGEVGYMLVGLGVGEVCGVSMYLMVYVMVGLGVWTMIRVGGVEVVKAMSNVGRENKSVGLGWNMWLVSMGGIPPMVGFLVKYEVLKGIGLMGEYVLVGIVMCSSVWSGYNYMEGVRRIRYGRRIKREGRDKVVLISEGESLLMAAVSIGVVVITSTFMC